MFTLEDRERLIRIDERQTAEITRGKDHEKRLRKVEHRMALWSGGGSAIGLLIGWFAKGHI